MLTLFILLCIVAAGIVTFANYKGHAIPSVTPDFKSFQYSYLGPFFIMAASDWMQGPYVYALYKSYGFSMGDIGILFLTGFASSMIFGTFMGSVSDKFGRKASCLTFAVLYSISCLTKHFNSFGLLMLGRLTGGIATSILFSAFESWMVSEHYIKKFPEEWMQYTFYLQAVGNSIIAIGSAVIASLVQYTFDSLVAPFDAAIVLLVVGATWIWSKWPENKGNSATNVSQTFVAGFKAIRNDVKVACIGISQSMFEAGMYIFIFMWTPTLDSYFQKSLSHGMVFAIFMVCAMIGSSIFTLLSQYLKVETVLLIAFASALVSLGIPIYVDNGNLVFAAFMAYEACVGVFWPSISTLKGKYIPDSVRATVMNYFRMPTNLFVVLTLGRVNEFKRETVFGIACGLTTLAIISQVAFIYLTKHLPSSSTRKGSNVDEMA